MVYVNVQRIQLSLYIDSSDRTHNLVGPRLENPLLDAIFMEDVIALRQRLDVLILCEVISADRTALVITVLFRAVELSFDPRINFYSFLGSIMHMTLKSNM